ncbi:unnamed protein product [Adineta ricciae]|uniref:Uncharacterized protein n=1 Tax=Adineta ricciae TaxID=249248 RepID=A0A814ELH2_ADIRI|nr:unnamed protein product [Adineta ricciae]CAF1619991.1 unnamed protein product [Adineta ricciae]
MSATKFSSYSCCTATVFLIVIIGFINQAQYANAYAYCQYYKPNDPWAYIKPCPSVCCPLTMDTRVNTTCCEPVSFYTNVTTTYTVFGYSWWIILVCVICSIAALCILCQSYQRFCGTKHGKRFNTAVDPEAAFTISKAVEAANPIGSYTVANDTITLDRPPSYSNQPSTPTPTSPPPYITLGTGMPKVSE